MASPSLCGTLWKLQALQDSSGPALIEPPGRPAELLLAVDQERVSGTGGCNRLIGGFPLAGEELSHSRFASTQMACLPEVMAIERRYSEAPRSGSALEHRQTQPAPPGRDSPHAAALPGRSIELCRRCR
jgi:heat shock protein HslJ